MEFGLGVVTSWRFGFSTRNVSGLFRISRIDQKIQTLIKFAREGAITSEQLEEENMKLLEEKLKKQGGLDRREHAGSRNQLTSQGVELFTRTQIPTPVLCRSCRLSPGFSAVAGGIWRGFPFALENAKVYDVTRWEEERLARR